MRAPNPRALLPGSEQHLRSMVAGAPVMLFAFDRIGTISLAAGAGLAAIEIQPGSTVGLSVGEVFGDEPALLDCVRRALLGEDVATIITLGDLSYALSCSPHVDEAGEVDRVIAVATDITSQTLVETELRARIAFDDLINRIFTLFIEIAPDDGTTAQQFDAAMSAALAEVGSFFGAARSYILEKSGDGSALVSSYEWGAQAGGITSDSRHEIPVESVPLIVAQIESGAPAVFAAPEDVPPALAAELEAFDRGGAQSMANVPLRTRGVVIGVVGCDWMHRQDVTEFDLTISQLTALQGLFGNALLQRKIGGALQNANRVLRALLECSDALIRAGDEKALLDEVCRIVVEVGGFRQAWVGFAAGDEAKSITPVAQWGYDPGYLENLKINWADS